MKIDLDEMLNPARGGMSYRDCRNMLRRVCRQHDDFILEQVMAWNSWGRRPAAAFLRDMARVGLAKRTKRAGVFEITDFGLRLLCTKALPRIGREKADTIVAKILPKVLEINADQECPYIVSDLRVFGSYVGDADDLGDIDVALATMRRIVHVENFSQACIRRTKMAGLDRGLIDAIAWSQREIPRKLSRLSRYIAIHRIDELERLQAPSALLYPTATTRLLQFSDRWDCLYGFVLEGQQLPVPPSNAPKASALPG